MSIPLFDAHCDTASFLIKTKSQLLKNSGHFDIERNAIFSPRGQFFAIFNDGKKFSEDLEEKFHIQLKNFKSQLELNSEKITLCRNAEDAENAFKNNKIAAFLSVEGAEQFGCDISRLEGLYEQGIRAVNITWNWKNDLSGSNSDGSEIGLSDKGRDFVAECERLGIMVDLSHISEPAFWDVCGIYNKPLFASHSNSKAVCNHRRNLTDEQFQAIVHSGGIAGINFYSEFLGPEPTVDTVIEHIDHFLSLGGENSVALGADFDGCDKLPVGIDSSADMGKLYDRMIFLGYSKSVINNIFINNLMRIVSTRKDD